MIYAPMGGMDCKCAMLAVHEKGRYTIRVRADQTEGPRLSIGAKMREI